MSTALIVALILKRYARGVRRSYAGALVTLQATVWRLPHKGETLAHYVRAAREARSFTIDDLVRETGRPTGTLRKIEGGQTKNPGLFTLLSIWHALNLPIAALDRVTTSTGSRARRTR